ncbi:MAG: aldose 1-epimerase family protein [Clostridia bacterium]|nr:aldose 1-epimerase family protein [Clostridia bacterium]
MRHSIENEHLKITVKEFGCELSSIYSKKTGFEYLWQGDEKIWSGQSPVLFPIVGRLLNDEYSFDGKTYKMAKHGFARRSEWEFLSSDENSMTFCLMDSEETRKSYPFSFEFYITFKLEENKLFVLHEIRNTGKEKMFFSLGAHPAFNCQIGDKLIFEKAETLDTFKIDLERSLLLSETVSVLKNETDLVITKDIFNEDALIFEGVKSEFVTLNTNGHSVRFNLGKAPYLGIWAKPGAPYVCIEPWLGLNDSPVKKDDFSQKTGINCLLAGEKFSYCWSAEMT